MIGTMRWLTIFLAVVVWQAEPESAEACSCGVPGGYPTDGDVDVPTDAALAFPAGDDLAPVLSKADGSVVPTRVRSERGTVGTWYLLAPLEELAPETEYVLSTYYSVRFTTGKGRAKPALTSADVISFDSAYTDFSTCESQLCGPWGETTTTKFEFRPSPEAVYYELVVTIDGESWRRPVPLNFFGRLGSFCAESPSIEPGQEACAELIAVGANGAHAAPGQIACVTGRSCDVADCDLEEVQACHQPEFLPGPLEPVPENDGDLGCSTSRAGKANTAILLLLVVLGLRRSRIHSTNQRGLLVVSPRPPGPPCWH